MRKEITAGTGWQEDLGFAAVYTDGWTLFFFLNINQSFFFFFCEFFFSSESPKQTAISCCWLLDRLLAVFDSLVYMLVLDRKQYNSIRIIVPYISVPILL